MLHAYSLVRYENYNSINFMLMRRVYGNDARLNFLVSDCEFYGAFMTDQEGALGINNFVFT